MKFSKLVGIATPQNGFEFFDLDVTGDTKVFIDPYFIRQNNQEAYVSRIDNITTVYLYDLLNLVRNNRRQEAYSFTAHFKETKGTGIGYANNKINGRGAGEVSSTKIVDAMFDSKVIVSQGVTRLEEFNVSCKGVGKDRISDIVLSVGKLGFIEFTQAQCRKHSINIKKTTDKIVYFCPNSKAWLSDYFYLPHINSPVDGKEQYIILIPTNILSKRVVYNVSYFINNVVIPYLQAKALREGSPCVQTRKNGERYVSKKELFKIPEYRITKKTQLMDILYEHPDFLDRFRRVEAPYRYNKLTT